MESNADEPDAKSGSRRRVKGFVDEPDAKSGSHWVGEDALFLDEELRTNLMLDQGVVGNVSNAS